MVYTLRLFLSSKCVLFHNSNVFGSCIIHILYTGCAKIKKKLFRRQKFKIATEPRYVTVNPDIKTRSSVRNRAVVTAFSLTKLLKIKLNLLYIRNQSVPRCKHFPPRLFKDQT